MRCRAGGCPTPPRWQGRCLWRTDRVLSAFLAVVLLSLFPSLVVAAPTIVLTDRAQAAGLGTVAVRGSSWQNAAVAFVDLDGDGWPDLYFGAERGKVDTLCKN